MKNKYLLPQQLHNHAAAIASELAADLYQITNIDPKIQSHKNNYTRFLYLQPAGKMQAVENANKASISFHTDHSKGALAKVLAKIADCGINLSKLQSMPIPAKEWQYSFHADMEFENITQFENSLQNIKGDTFDLKIFGVYKNVRIKKNKK